MQIDTESVERIKVLAVKVEQVAHTIAHLTSPTEDVLREERNNFEYVSPQLLIALDKILNHGIDKNKNDQQQRR